MLVKVDRHGGNEPLLLEYDKEVEDATGLQVVDTLLSPSQKGVAQVLVTNASGFTQVAGEGVCLGGAMETAVIESTEQGEAPILSVCGGTKMQKSKEDEFRRQSVGSMFESTHLPEPGRTKLKELLEDHHQAFGLGEGERGETELVEMEIDTGDAAPKKQRVRRMPFAVRREVARQLRSMQEMGVIRPSSSPWASPVVMVRKKDGSHRFCIVYHELNAVTKPDSFPLLRFDDLLDQLGQSHFFSTLDLASGYWQIRVHHDSIPKTAFIIPQGLFEFNVMPFGLTNAPSVFQRLMQRVLLGLNPEEGPDFVYVYIDDVLVFSRTLDDHLEHLGRVIRRIQEAGLKLKPSKCHFLRTEVECLGHMITPQGLKTNPALVSAVKEFPTPRNVRETRQFLGLSSYYRRFISSFAKIARPLHQLTKKEAQFIWNEECQTAFKTLKRKLCEAPVLAYPSFDRDFTLETDASIEGIGAVLSQHQDDGHLHPVAYAS